MHGKLKLSAFSQEAEQGSPVGAIEDNFVHCKRPDSSVNNIMKVSPGPVP